MKRIVLSLAAALVLAGCSDDPEPSGATTDAATDTGASADTGAPSDTGAADAGSDASDAAADDAAEAGPTISSDPNAPTPLAIGTPVTATLAGKGEHFFEYTPTDSGDHTLHFVAPGTTWYANHSTVKDTHFCGPPKCAQGTADAPLAGLVAGTTYYLNVYNGTGASGSYTLSVTYP